MTGQRVGQYLLGDELGRGPLGVVYRAESAEGGRVVALKLLAHPATRSPAFLARFPADMLPFQRLSHPNVVKYHDSGVHDGQAWYATEYVEGTSLEALLKATPRKGGEPGLAWADDVLRVAVQVARALKHGHHRGLIHRGLKPANLLLTAQGVVKVADFGLAKVLPIAATDLPAEAWGTAGFMAPEQFTGKPVTRRSDLYSLGCVLYALTTGRPPFTAATLPELLHKHCYTLPDRPASFAPDIPPDLDDLICTLIAKDPNRRPASAAAVIEELGQLRAKAERKGRSVAWPADPGDESGPLPALGQADEFEAGRAPRRPLMARPLVVGPLFLLLVAAALTLAFWPRPSAAELFAQAQPLLQSDDPTDWERAWDAYLQPMVDSHPEAYPKEVAEARAKIAERRELRRSLEQGTKAEKVASEGERLYRRGLKLAEAGDWPAARRTWEQLRTAFGGVEAEARWIRLAGVALTMSEGHGTRSPGESLRAALGAARDPAAWAALEELYRDDPEALRLIRASGNPAGPGVRGPN